MEFFDGTEVLEVSDPPSVVRKRNRVERREQVAHIRAESAPELSPDGKVHNDFTAWLAMQHLKESVSCVGNHLEAVGC